MAVARPGGMLYMDESAQQAARERGASFANNNPNLLDDRDTAEAQFRAMARAEVTAGRILQEHFDDYLMCLRAGYNEVVDPQERRRALSRERMIMAAAADSERRRTQRPPRPRSSRHSPELPREGRRRFWRRRGGGRS